MLLELKNVSKRFGGMTAISKVDLGVKPAKCAG
jgi:ABC-type branched-subunit amino acid transport system ATPase component